MENYDFEKEKEKLESLAERAHRLIYRLHKMSVDNIDMDFPKPNAEVLQDVLCELELLLPQLKEQLEYMLKHERKRDCGNGFISGDGIEYILKCKRERAAKIAAFIDSLGDDKTMAKVVDELSDKVVSMVESAQ